MSKAISLKINDEIFKETEELVEKVHRPRNLYINQALSYYNRLIKRELLRKQYRSESRLVADESLRVNRELEELDD